MSRRMQEQSRSNRADDTVRWPRTDGRGPVAREEAAISRWSYTVKLTPQVLVSLEAVLDMLILLIGIL